MYTTFRRRILENTFLSQSFSASLYTNSGVANRDGFVMGETLIAEMRRVGLAKISDGTLYDNASNLLIENHIRISGR